MPRCYSVGAAASLLTSHGSTVVPGGTSTCAKPGTGPGDSGAGSPAGTKLAFNVIYVSDPVILGEELTAWASDAKKVGINMTLQPGMFSHVATVANDPRSPTTINQWAVAGWGGFTCRTTRRPWASSAPAGRATPTSAAIPGQTS